MDREDYKRWYHEVYLRSDHWLELKDQAWERYGDECQRCRRIGEQNHLHHTHYRTLHREHLGVDVVWICADCHSFIHGISSFDPLSPLPEIHSDIWAGATVEREEGYTEETQEDANAFFESIKALRIKHAAK